MIKLFYTFIICIISFNIFAGEEVFCYEKLECPIDDKPSACKGTGEKSQIWNPSNRSVIVSLKKGTYILKEADSKYGDPPQAVTGRCDYGPVVQYTNIPLINKRDLPKWIKIHSPSRLFFYHCQSSNPSECAFEKYP